MTISPKPKVTERAVSFEEPALNLIETPLSDEMEKSFLEYSYSVIYSRALPSAEDGVKPVQRRLLYTMLVKGYTPDKPYVKSARPVADCMGTFHPHGDSSIYDTLVRMAQGFTMRVPLIDGYGNFGGQPGDSPGSARYTECRMSKEALLLTEEIKEDTVDTRPNYDGETTEPVVLPVQFPNLLINGGSGIAVGMATNMAPHNPVEVLGAARWLLTHPDADLDKLMEFVPGPDFPTGGLILGMDGIREAYETGRGKFRIRGRYTIESTGRGKHQIIFTELPYSVAAVKIVEAAKKSIEEKKLQGIADIRDLTDRRSGIRLVFETKVGVNPEAVVLDLFQHTPLEDTFGVNNNCLVDGEPKVIGLKEILEIFVAQRLRVVTRRTKNRKEKKDTRLHLVEGLLKALTDIDKVIAIVRRSADADIAKDTLIKTFKVDEVQADYILSLQLRRLTKFDQLELTNEKKQLTESIAELKKILTDEKVLRALVGDELVKTSKALETPRLSVLVGGNLAEHLEEAKQAQASANLEIEDNPCIITLFASGAITRTSEAVVVNGRGKIDPIISQIDTTTRGHVVLVTNQGNGFRVQALHITKEAKSSAVQIGVALKSGEKIVTLGRNEAKDGEAGLALGTKQGTVKITTTDFPLRADEFPVISLTEGDEVIGGGWVSDASTTDLAFISTDASLLRFEAVKIRPQGSKGGGMAGIKLTAGSHAIAFAVLSAKEREKAEVVTYTGKTIKRSLFSQAPIKGRSTGGQRFHMLRSGLGESGLKFALISVNALAVDSTGKAISLPNTAKRDASGTPTDAVPAVGGSRS